GHGALERDHVHPAAAAGAAGGGAVFLAAIADALPDFVVQFGRERAAADAGGVSLGDAEHVVDRVGADPGAGQRAAGGRVGGRDVGIGAVVDVQQRALRAFEQHAPALLAQVVQDAGDVALHRLDVLAEGQRLVERLLEIDGFGLEVIDQHEVVVVERGAQFLGELIGIVQVRDADAATRDLVLVGRADAAPGGADGGAAGGLLARLVEGDVVRHDDRRRRADLQPRAHVHAGGLQLLDLLAQRARVQYHAVADQAQRVVAQDARRDQVQHGLLAVDHQRVAGVVAALEAHDRADVLRQQVDDLALAFIAPLGTENDD